MYELNNGTSRLVEALYNRKNDRKTIEVLSKELNYCDDQLKQDIQALYDFYCKKSL